MAGIALLLDLLKRTQGSSSPSSSAALSLHSHGLFTAGAAASAAAAYIAASRPFASRAIFGDGGISVAYCDAGATATWNENLVSSLPFATENLLNNESIKYKFKEYPIELRPLFSAFQIRSLALISLRSLLCNLPLLVPRPPVEDDDDGDGDSSQDHPEERPVDLVLLFQNSIKQIVRETSNTTIRRLLERLAVHYCSQRVAWKLLKDVSKSAKRKAGRDMPAYLFLFHVSRSTLRGHALCVVASWIVEIIIECYRNCILKPDEDTDDPNTAEKNRLFKIKVYKTTIKFTSSLIFASIGAGIGALFHPSAGQWIGSAVGDFAGPVIVSLSFEKLHLQL